MIFPFVFVGVGILTKLLHITAHILHIAITITTYLYCTLRHKKVVGYQELETVSVGKVMVAPTFLNANESDKCFLSDLKVTGYTAPSKNAKGNWINGCGGGKFILEKLTTSGTREAGYYCIDNGTIGPGWFADGNGTAIEGGASAISITSGKGLWTQGSGYILNFPAPEL